MEPANKIVGMSVVGEGEADRWLDLMLNDFHRLCDDAVIALCNADRRTKRMVEDSGFLFYEDNREWGKDQPHIKTDLLEQVSLEEPDWILPMDADEQFDETVTREVLEQLANDQHFSYSFYVVNLWNDEQHFWKQGSFWNVRFFKYAPSYGTQFLKRNVHCGWAPPFFYQWGWWAPHILWHRGLQRPQDREQKDDRYKRYDPNEDKLGFGAYYAAIRGEGGGAELELEALRGKVGDFVNNLKPRETTPMTKQVNKKFHAMKRPSDGKVISDIRDQDVERRLKDGYEYLYEIDPNAPKKEEKSAPKTTTKKTTRKSSRKTV